MSNILDGKELASQLKATLRADVLRLKERTGKVPSLVNLLIGDNHGSCAYAKSQQKVAQAVGIDYKLEILPENITQDELIELLKQLNSNPNVNGIMIHKPVPAHIDYKEAAIFIDTQKDLEGINVENIGKMIIGETKIIPCTPASVMAHIKSTGVNIRGKEAVVVGASEIVGKPLSLLLLEQHATVTVCHIATSEAGRLKEHVQRADVLIVAVGKASVINGDWIKEGSIVIDVGINRIDNKIVGDIEFDTAREKAAYITPVPGGVGPLTVVMLMRNGIETFKSQNAILDVTK